MCMVCRGLKNNKLSLEEAIEKYEEFIELDLLDEDHQEKVESLIAEAEEEAYYWSSAKKDYLIQQDDFNENDLLEEELANDEYLREKEDEDYENDE